MMMRHAVTLASLATALLAVAACNELAVTPGQVTTTTRPVQGVERVTAGNSFEIVLIRDTAESLTIEAPEGFLPYIRTEVSGGTLNIDLDERVSSRFSPKRITLHFRSLDGITASGAASFTSADTMTGNAFALTLSGASRAAFPVRVGTLNCEASGASVVSLTGSAGNLNTSDFSGASILHAYNLNATSCDVHASGASYLDVTAVDRLDVHASGGSVVSYRGHPKVTQDVSGGSSVVDAN